MNFSCPSCFFSFCSHSHYFVLHSIIFLLLRSSTVTAEAYCNYHDGLFALLLFNTGDGFSEMVDVVSKYSSQFELNRLAYSASFSNIISFAPNPTEFDFCESNGTTCSMVILRMLDYKQQISDMYLTVTEGACVDSFSSTMWSSLESTPPTSLQEDYFTCTQYWYDAAFDSLGIASV